jgi:hypothetical protein
MQTSTVQLSMMSIIISAKQVPDLANQMPAIAEMERILQILPLPPIQLLQIKLYKILLIFPMMSP